MKAFFALKLQVYCIWMIYDQLFFVDIYKIYKDPITVITKLLIYIKEPDDR